MTKEKDEARVRGEGSPFSSHFSVSVYVAEEGMREREVERDRVGDSVARPNRGKGSPSHRGGSRRPRSETETEHTRDRHPLLLKKLLYQSLFPLSQLGLSFQYFFHRLLRHGDLGPE